jgi:predicted transcriptional regulator of viral defense system
MDSDIDVLIAAVAAAHHGVFSLRHLQKHKVSHRARQHRLDSGRWIQVHARAYRIAGTPASWRSDLLAACWAAGSRAVASHRSAAMLWELPGRREDLVEITCPRWRRARHDGLLVHETTRLSLRDVTTTDAIPVTTVERTIFDLCAVTSSTTADLAIDNALRRGLTDLATLERLLRRVGGRGRPGTQRFRALLQDRSPNLALTDSERERLLLRMLRRHGFPSPIPQFEIRDDDGRLIARPDFAYPDRKIAIEYDSYQEHTGKVALVRDSARRNAIVARGWAPIAATAEDLRRGGHQLASDLRMARAQRLAEPAS